jgi:hypothetical protein
MQQTINIFYNYTQESSHRPFSTGDSGFFSSSKEIINFNAGKNSANAGKKIVFPALESGKTGQKAWISGKDVGET